MISLNLTNNDIPGLNRLFQKLPRSYEFNEAYLKGVLLHDDGDVQLTYSIKKDVTYLFTFRMKACKGKYELRVPTDKTIIRGISIFRSCENTSFIYKEETNGIDIECEQIETNCFVIINKEFGEEQTIILTQQYSRVLQDKMKQLETLRLQNGECLFRHDDSYNNLEASHHMMYKLPDLKSADGSIVYEFLVELDIDEPCLGIYYGCRAIIKQGDSKKQIDRLRQEWIEPIEPRICRRLNDLFPDKKFDNRFKPTDNAFDNTFWPFWITLYEDENIEEVATRATIIIRDEYKRYLEKDTYVKDAITDYVVKKVCKGAKETHSNSRFTEESWENLRNPWKDESQIKYNAEWAVSLDKFISGAVREGFIVEHVDGYEKAFQLTGSTTTFAICIQLLINRIHNDEINVPWGRICKQFLAQGGKIISEDTIKNSCSRYFKKIKDDFLRKYEKWDYHVKKQFEEDPYPDKNVRIFKKIMS